MPPPPRWRALGCRYAPPEPPALGVGGWSWDHVGRYHERKDGLDVGGPAGGRGTDWFDGCRNCNGSTWRTDRRFLTRRSPAYVDAGVERLGWRRDITDEGIV